MKTLEMLHVLDRLDQNFKIPFIRSNQLKMFFPNEDKIVFLNSLKRSVDCGVLGKVCRGLYYNPRSKHMPEERLFEVAALIRDRETFYLSLESVLSEEGMISQIPFRLTFVSKEKSQVFETPFGTIEFSKGNVGNLSKRTDVFFNEHRGIYEATSELALKDAYRHKRVIDLIKETRGR